MSQHAYQPRACRTVPQRVCRRQRFVVALATLAFAFTEAAQGGLCSAAGPREGERGVPRTAGRVEEELELVRCLPVEFARRKDVSLGNARRAAAEIPIGRAV